MDRREHEVVYSGAVAAGRDPAQVKSDLARLFKADAAGIERLFGGRAVVIKKGIDRQTALKYRDALEKIGALCEIRARVPADARGAPPSSASPEAPAVNDPEPVTIAPAGAILTAQRQVKTPFFDLGAISMAEPGADILEGIDTSVSAPVFDLSRLSMAPAGVELIEATPIERAPLPEFTGLTIAEAGEDIVAAAPAATAALPDVSRITIAPAGAEIIRPEEKKPRPAPPEIGGSALSLEAVVDTGQ